MAQIRETIESLCIVLKYNGISEITAETFRLAKFDNPYTTKPMWFTLKNLILWLKMLKNGDKIDFLGETRKIPGELTVRFCRHEMFSRGYRVRAFFALPEKMDFGSQEILLAIGWLIAKENLIKKFASRTKRTINEDLPFRESDCTGISPTGNSLNLTSHSKFTNEKEKLLHIIEGIIVLKGKLEAACRGLLAAKNEYSRLLNRIHTATLPFPQKPSSSSNHLSANDVYLLYNERELIKHQEKLEYENLYLKSLIYLMDKESSFWKWMESTLDAKLKNSEENSEESEIQESWTCSNVDYKPSKGVQSIKAQQVEFSRFLQKQENLYMDVSTKWKRYKTAVEESKKMQEDFLDLLSCLDQEVLTELDNTIEKDLTERLSDSWTLSLSMMQLSALDSPLKLITPNLQQRKKCKSADIPTAEQSVIVRVIQTLFERDELLKQELFNIKKEHENRMVKLSLSLKDVVCIPPCCK